jgi:hypothetical protein
MPVVQVSLADLAEVLKRGLEQIRPHVLQEVYKSVATLGPVTAMQHVANAQPRQPVDRGEYIRSFKTALLEDAVVFYNDTKYAGVLEAGRRPGRKAPPVAALTAWVLRKGLAGNAPGHVTGVGDDKVKTAKAIAFAISKKMAKQGWPFNPNQPMRILGKTIDDLAPEIAKAVQRGLASALTPL